MATYRVEFHPGALEDAAVAAAWYTSRSLQVAERFELALSVAIATISHHAERAAPDESGIRWIRLKRFPYRLNYLIGDSQTAYVLSIAHAHQHPDYWRDRLS